MYFSREEKIAIQRMITAMVAADGRIDAKEAVLNTVVNAKIGITQEHNEASLNMSLQEAVEIVKRMTLDEKRFVCAYLGTMMSIDSDVDANEMLLWSLLTSTCGFPQMTIAEAATIIANIE